MEVYVDDVPIDTVFEGAATLEDALAHVQSHSCPADHLVIGLRCDGQDVPGNAMADTLRRPASSCELLEVFTGTKATLVTDAMAQASACLTETQEACQRVAGLLTEGKTVEAAEALGECLRVWQQIHEAVAKSIQMLQLDASKTTVNDEPLLAAITKPKEILLQVKEALQVRDHVLLADILQYEFPEVTAQWHAIIAKLRQEAEALETSRGL